MALQYLVSAEEMKRYDAYTIKQIGIPSMVLMERAAIQVVQSMQQHLGELKDKRILAVCGGGNNGGDGLAAARLLLEQGIPVDICLVASEEKCTEQTRQQAGILAAYCTENLFFSGPGMLPNFPLKEYAIIIDALFGVGLSRPIEGEYALWIEAVNTSGAYVVSVDIPSGIDTDSGHICGCAVKADLTVTFAFPKRGLFLYPGKEYAGKIDLRQIGITKQSFADRKPVCFTYDSYALPKRRTDGNKGTFGKLLVIAGSKDMCGACLLCGKSAYRVGAGMVKIVTEEANRQILQTAFPEAMLLTYREESLPVEKLSADFNWADGIVIGPGMGQSSHAENLLETVLAKAPCSLILDADALNLLAKSPKLRHMLTIRRKQFPDADTILTPHQGELARLMGRSIGELKENPVQYAKKLAEELSGVVVSKDAVTIVCDSGETFFINSAGNSGMATAGSGDVLAGILGGLLVQREWQEGNFDSAFYRAAKGVTLHAHAGDLAKARVGEHAMLAGDLMESLNEISRKTSDEASKE